LSCGQVGQLLFRETCAFSHVVDGSLAVFYVAHWSAPFRLGRSQGLRFVSDVAPAPERICSISDSHRSSTSSWESLRACTLRPSAAISTRNALVASLAERCGSMAMEICLVMIAARYSSWIDQRSRRARCSRRISLVRVSAASRDAILAERGAK